MNIEIASYAPEYRGVDTGEIIQTPRPFQHEAIEAILREWASSVRSTLLSVPTGGGKTVIFAFIIRWFCEQTGLPCLILAHQHQLIAQAVSEIHNVWGAASIGIVESKIKQFNEQITVAMVQTLSIPKTLSQLPPVGLVVTDEAHHSYGKSYRSIFDHINQISPSYLHLGVTATPMRMNKKESLMDIYQSLAYSVTMFRLISEGYLCPLDAYSIKTSLDLSRVKTVAGDFGGKSLSQAVAAGDFNATVVDEYIKRAKGKKAICFAVDVEHAETLTNIFRKYRVAARCVHDGLKPKECLKVFGDYRKGRFPVLINVKMAAEGFNDKETEVILCARPTKSLILYTQMIGRGLRTNPGKKSCLLLDFTDNSRNGAVMTLKDVFAFYQMPSASKILREYATDERPLRIDKETIQTYNMLDEIGEAKSSQGINFFDVNDFAWSKADGNMYVGLRKDFTVGIIKTAKDGKFNVYLCKNAKEEKWYAKIGPSEMDHDHALSWATRLLVDFGDNIFAQKDSAWRSKDPSDMQKKAVSYLYPLYRGIVLNTSMCPTKFTTSAHYSDLITAYATLSNISGGGTLTSKEFAEDYLKGILRNEVIDTQVIDVSALPWHRYILHFSEEIHADVQAAVQKTAAWLHFRNKDMFPFRVLMTSQLSLSGKTLLIEQKQFPSHPLTQNEINIVRQDVVPVVQQFIKDLQVSVIPLPDHTGVLNE